MEKLEEEDERRVEGLKGMSLDIETYFVGGEVLLIAVEQVMTASSRIWT